MRPLAFAALFALLSAAVLVADDRTLLYSTPAPPSQEALDRLHLKMCWRVYVPMDGRRDGFFTVHFDRGQVLVQTRSGLVACLDQETGQTAWTARPGRAYKVTQPLGYNAGTVLAVNGNDLYALDRVNGTVQWQISLPEALSTAPVADDDQMYLPGATGRMHCYFLPKLDIDGNLFKGYLKAYDPTLGGAGSGGKQSGDKREGNGGLGGLRELDPERRRKGPTPLALWQYPTRLKMDYVPLQTSEFILPVAPSGEGATLTKVNLLDKSTSEAHSRFEAEGAIIAQPTRYDEVAYIGSGDANLYAYNIVSGRTDWRFTVGSAVTRQPYVTESDVFVTGERNGLARVDRKTGEAGWRIPRGNRVSHYQPEADRVLAANPKFVYATDRSGRLLVLDRRRGTQLSSLDTRDFAFPVMNLENDRLYLAAHSGLLVCLHDREYAKPLRHFIPAEEKPIDPATATPEQKSRLTKKKLIELISEPAGDPAPLTDVLAALSKKYSIKLQLHEKSYRDLSVPLPNAKLVAIPRSTREPLGRVLQNMLNQVDSTFVVIADAVLIVPKAPKN